MNTVRYIAILAGFWTEQYLASIIVTLLSATLALLIGVTALKLLRLCLRKTGL